MKLNGIIARMRVAAMTVSGFLMSVVLVIIFLPSIISLYLVSRFIFLLIWLKHGDKFTRPGGLDTIQGMESHQSRPFIHATVRYAGKIGVEFIRARFLKLIYEECDENGQPRFRRLRQILEKVYGYHIFRDVENFDISKHILDISIEELFPEKFPHKPPKNGFSNGGLQSNGTNGVPRSNGFHNVGLHTATSKDNNNSEGTVIEWERVMQRVLDVYGSTPLPEGLPQWQAFVIYEGASDHTTLLIKINHGFTDGIYFLRFFLEYVGDQPVNCLLPYNYHQPTFIKRFLDLFWAFCLLPYGICRLSFPYENNPFHGPQLSGDKMYLVSKPFDLSILKTIKKATKVSMNAILFSCLSHAVATHFSKKKSTVPHIIVLVPISLQDMERPVKLKNRFGLKGVLLPTFLDKNSTCFMSRTPEHPIERLNIVQDWINRTRDDPSFLAIHWLLVFLCSLMPSSALYAMWRSKGLTTTLSNVAGAQDEDHVINGFRKTDFAFWIPDRNPLGMGVSVAGYQGRIRVGLMIDKIFMNDEREGNEFLESFFDEVHNLCNVMNVRRSTNGVEQEEYTSLIINKEVP